MEPFADSERIVVTSRRAPYRLGMTVETTRGA
jgi:hypothetical protein